MRSFPFHLSVFFLYIFTTLFNGGCNSPIEEKDNDYYYQLEEANDSKQKCNLILSDTLKFELGSQISPLMMNGRLYSENDQHYLSFFSNGTQAFNLFPINTDQAKSISIPIEKEGPEGISHVDDFFIQSLDSIFILSGRMNQKMIYLINQSGELRSKWDLNKHLPDKYKEYWFGHESEIGHYRMHFTTEKNELYFYLYKGLMIEMETQATFTQIAFNLENNKTRKFGKLPTEFKEKSFYPMFGMGGIFTSNKIINFYPSLNDLVLYDSDSLKLIKALHLKSKYSNNLVVGAEEIGYDPPLEQERDFLTESDFYTHMLANSTGDYVYRFIKLGQSAKTLDGENRDPLDLNFSVQILDEDLNLILEKDFSDSEAMFFLESFAIDNKLYISYNNPLNPNFSENHRQYYVYEIVCE
ncbi:DUF4221 family protein [Marivirga harenae]|uniref:DUF4221 family protein n=1 Tax=Marivirga harenae TaxID=2010992 RepID=UPI0026DFA5A4|nr:DUF4221 family protein [Marivirga harenae]WKV13122.1 DUF4221 family protein [Marivirga harenae]